MPTPSPVNSNGWVRSKLQQAAQRTTYLVRAWRLVWTATKSWTIPWFILLIVQGLLPAATVYLTKILVDNLSAAVGGGLSWESVRPVLYPAVAMGTILLLSQVLGGLLAWIRAAQSELVEDYIKALVHSKAGSVDIEFYETPELSDKLARANSESATRSLSILENLGSLLQNTLTLVAVAALLIPYSFWLPLVLLLSTLPALWVVVHHSVLHHEWWEQTTERRRWAHYFDQLLTFPTPAAEIRLFDLAIHFRDQYGQLRKQLRDGRLRLLKRQNVAQFVASSSALVVTVSTLVWMVGRALRGMATLGDIALFYQAFNQGQGLMRALLSSLGQLYADGLFLEHLFTFLDLEAKITDPENPVEEPIVLGEGITFCDVSFRYPGSDSFALNGFNLFVPVGKTVALVGPNGAGKTTVTKLLCRFYDPDHGEIRIGDTDIREIRLVTLRRLFTVLFQYPVRYVASIGRNISLGDIRSEPDEHKIVYAADGGGAREIAEKLPRKYDTLLGKHFKGGVELSGGEWQRVTLARAFYRESPLVILDEPTSFMDSWAEAAWLDRFRELVHGRSAIIITHRFTTAMRADIIHVMDDGKIVESGTHEELLHSGGLYAASWTAQMEAEKRVLTAPNP